MNMVDRYMISKETGTLQLPYSEYVALLEKLEEARRTVQVKARVLADLQRLLAGKPVQAETVMEIGPAPRPQQVRPVAKPVAAAGPKPVAPEKVSIEFSPQKPEGHSSAVPAKDAGTRPAAKPGVPSIKKEIAEHFNESDVTGRLFNVFKQYYTCLNEACGGTVRVTMKDGVCSLWNYDAWEEFAFMDIHEGELRIAVDPCHADELSQLNSCEVPRVLSRRRKLIGVRVGNLNNTILNVLSTAFAEADLAAS